MTKKMRVGLISGGLSCEHEVTLASCRNVLEAIDRNKYEPIPIFIDKRGSWHLIEPHVLLSRSPIDLVREGLTGIQGAAFTPLHDLRAGAFDVLFPLLHGPFGEDGSVQGLFKLLRLPFVGAGILGSAIAMDKDVMKRLLVGAGLPVTRFQVYRRPLTSDEIEQLVAQWSLPLFVKPANMGSSVGVRKAHSRTELADAVCHALTYDRKILVEEFVPGIEIECAILGNDAPLVSLVGEICHASEFYTYEAKYLDERFAIKVPAHLPQAVSERAQALAKAAFQVLECEGMARVDMFLKPTGEVLVNEINTIPGFTATSTYSQLWGASGIAYEALIDRLIQLAIARHEQESALKTGTAK